VPTLIINGRYDISQDFVIRPFFATELNWRYISPVQLLDREHSLVECELSLQSINHVLLLSPSMTFAGIELVFDFAASAFDALENS
jgi:hypothetical protein